MELSTIRIRPMARRDLDRVCEIEREVFTMPWSREAFESELELGGCVFPWVAESEGEVIGYLISWLIEDEIHVGNIAVVPRLQGRGVGRRLFSYCLGRAADRGAARATLEVRVGNDRAIALYESSGFIPVALRKSYYSDTGEDAVVMLKTFPVKEAAE
jgi:ribosomal-protein-alanine N-acetyltransferase